MADQKTSVMEIDLKEFYDKTLKESQAFINTLSFEEKEDVKNYVVNSLLNKIDVDDNKNRIALVKFLLVFLPETIGILQGILSKKKTKADYELHFSIFCFLDQIIYLKNGKKLSSELLKIVSDYLVNVKKDTAEAAWMAGDLLGAHWEKTSGFAVLKNALHYSKSDVGKNASLYGIYKIYELYQDVSALDILNLCANDHTNKETQKFAINLLDRVENKVVVPNTISDI